MSGINDGQPVDAANSNPAWLPANGDGTALGVIALDDQGTPVVSGAAVTNIQRQQNSFASFIGAALNGIKNLLPSWTSDEGFSANQSLFARLNAVSTKFKTSGGHSHNPAVAGDGAAVDATYIANARLRALIQQGVNIIAATGVSSDISVQMALKNPSGNDSTKGVVTNAPYNLVALRQASGVNQGDSFYDGSGNLVYGRITYAASVWTLSFYVLIGSVETAYNFSSPTDISFYYQEIFNGLTEGPVYNAAFFVPSENTTADVVDASPTSRGLVNTLPQSFAGIKQFNDGIDLNNQLIENVLNPSAKLDGANKTYVDAFGGTAFIASTGGSTTLNVNSARDIVTTGTLTHNYVLPSTALLQVGNWWRFVNRSTVAITVQSSTPAGVATIPPNSVAFIRVSSIATQSWGQYIFPIFNAADGSINMANGKIVNVLNPTNPQDAATKNYVDSVAGGGSTINARYQTAAGQVIANNSTDIINFDFQDFDNTGGAIVTGAAWRFTAATLAEAGLYSFDASVMAGGIGNNGYIRLEVFKNGVLYSSGPSQVSINASDQGCGVSDLIYLGVGDYFDIRFTNANTGNIRTLFPSLVYNYISIAKIGS